MSVVNSIIMTVFNRPKRVLWNTLHALRKNDLTNCEVLIIDDGSTIDYEEQKSYASQYEMPVRWIRIEPEEYPPTTYMIPHDKGGVYNNCVMATNRGIAEAVGRRVMLLSSDCMLPSHAVKAAKSCEDHFWLASVVDQETNLFWVGDHRLLTVNWFVSAKKEHIDAIGGFDEEYMKGMAFEDADFGARLGLYLGHIVFDMSVLVVHQSHPPFAYSDGRQGFHRSEKYTREKWGGMPWGTIVHENPLDVGVYKENKLIRVNISLKDGFKDPLNGLRLRNSLTAA